MVSDMTIGRLAAQAGVNVETIRYYQRRGLLAEPPRPATGQRRYPPLLVKRVRFIKRAQLLGFTLDDILDLLDLDQAGACSETRELAARKLHSIQSKLKDLTAMCKALSKLVRACDSVGNGGSCPIIHALASD